jgi:hypothetical protein
MDKFLSASLRLRPVLACDGRKGDSIPRFANEHLQTRIGLELNQPLFLPTGSGKTAIFTSLIHRLPPLINPHSGALGNRVLILAGSIVLAQQAADTVRRTYPELVSGQPFVPRPPP